MKKIFLFFLFTPLLLFSNMAKPWMDGSQHSVLFGSGKVSVQKEIIDIRLKTSSGNEIYFANYKIRYHIFSEQKQTIPLLFIAIDLKSAQNIKVNQIPTEAERLDLEKKEYSFIKKTDKGIFVKYDKVSDVPVNPSD